MDEWVAQKKKSKLNLQHNGIQISLCPTPTRFFWLWDRLNPTHLKLTFLATTYPGAMP